MMRCQEKPCRGEGAMMRRIIGILCVICLCGVTAGAEEVRIPLGTKVEGETMFGAYAPEPGANPNNPNPFLAIRALQNPVGVGGDEIPLKNCIFLGDVVSDLTINRAYFKASRIKCANAKEMNGSAIRGYAVDQRDNKLGIRGVVQKADPPPKFVEVPSGERVYLVIVEGVSVTIK